MKMWLIRKFKRMISAWLTLNVIGVKMSWRFHVDKYLIGVLVGRKCI